MLMLSMKIIVAVIFIESFQCVRSQYSNVNWCDPDLSCDGGLMKNSMCYMTRDENRGPCYFMQDAMTEDNKRMVLALHNSFRDQLASGAVPEWPQASNMRQLSWDDALAKQATTWAFQCDIVLDPCPKNPKYAYVGQAMGTMAETEGHYPELDSVFKMMVEDGTVANKSSLKPPNAYTNFVQISFAEQTKIGCGLVRFLQQSPKKLAMFTTSLVCFYAQGTGNSKDLSSWDSLTYKEGEPCSFCPIPTRCDPESSYKYLCAISQDSLGDSYTFAFTAPPLVGNGNQLLPTTLIISSCLFVNMIYVDI